LDIGFLGVLADGLLASHGRPDSFGDMTSPERAAATQTSTPRKPRDEELDFFGLTHRGRVRRDNQDHYLVCTLHKTARVRSTSLPNPELYELPSQRLASFGMVADGVGGSTGGETASRAAIESITFYVKETMNAFYAADENDEQEFFAALEDAAQSCHRAVLERADATRQTSAATTLTLFIAVWPSLYILQVGDSRLYRFRDGKLEQLTRDQTMAQDLVDSGVLTKDKAAKSPLAHMLTSAMGGPAARPEVIRADLRLGDAVLLCTDGLTKHVSDRRISELMRTMTSAEQVVRALVDEALAGGGTDNVTALVVSGVRRRPA
jgi:protein phosphatase